MTRTAAFNDRKCSGCGWQLSPTESRSWTMNKLVPLGSTATYECAICGNSFLLRTPWHLMTLLIACGLYGWVLVTTDDMSLLEVIDMVLLVSYSAFAIGEHLWNAKKNPAWRDSDDSQATPSR